MLIGIILLVFGAGRLFFLIYEWRQDCYLFREGVRTMGRVTNRATYPSQNSPQTSQYLLIAEFIDGKGYTNFVKSRRHVYGSRSREFMGTELEVVYLEENPERVRFAFDQEKHISWCGVIFYPLTAVAGIMFILSSLFIE